MGPQHYLQFSYIRLDIIVIVTGIRSIFRVKFVDRSQEQIVKPRAVWFFQLLACFQFTIYFSRTSSSN